MAHWAKGLAEDAALEAIHVASSSLMMCLREDLQSVQVFTTSKPTVGVVSSLVVLGGLIVTAQRPEW